MEKRAMNWDSQKPTDNIPLFVLCCRFFIALFVLVTLSDGLSASQYEVEQFNKLPSNVRKHATDLRASCNEMKTPATQGSADYPMRGIYELDLDGTGNIAIVVDDLEICGGVYMGANCGNRAGCHLIVYQRNRFGTYEATLTIEKYGSRIVFDASTKRLWMMVLEIHASEPPCQPSDPATMGRHDHCHVMTSYKDGQWRWLRDQELAGVISAIGTSYAPNRR